MRAARGDSPEGVVRSNDLFAPPLRRGRVIRALPINSAFAPLLGANIYFYASSITRHNKRHTS
jgi:hypothetical protein